MTDATTRTDPTTMTADEFRAWLGSPAARRSKYGNVRTVVDGITFASAAESRRYAELRLRLHAGEIANLRLQPRYALVVNGVKVCTYVADFAYTDVLQGGGEVCEDIKGMVTRVYAIKRALMLALHGIVIKEIRV